MQNGTMIQYFHWYLPTDGNFWKQLKEQAAWLADVGITSVWIPPATKGTSGGYSVGYDVYDLYDLGEFDQKGTVRTKYGTKDELVAASQAVHEAGMQLYIDIVLNHKGGGDEKEKVMAIEVNGENRNETFGEEEIEVYTKFTFPGRQGKYSDFVWDFQCFSGVDYADNLGRSGIFSIKNDYGDMWQDVINDEKGNYDYLMYCDVEFRNPHVREEVKKWALWMHEVLGFDGVRLDAVKHMPYQFFNEWLDAIRSELGKEIFAVGEYWAPGRIDLLQTYIKATEGRMSLFDAALHHNFHDAATQGRDYDLATIFDGSLVKENPAFAVTVVANHDTQPLQALEAPIDPWFKPHAYCLTLLRADGYPVVFYPDLMSANYTDKGSDGNDYDIYMPKIEILERLIEIRSKLAYGEQRDYFDHNNTIGWTRAGLDEKPGSGCAVLICNGDEGFKIMEMGKQHAGKKFVDATGGIQEAINIDENGFADFRVAAGSIAVWIDEAVRSDIKY